MPRNDRNYERNYYQSAEKGRKEVLPPKPELKKPDPYKVLPSSKLTAIKCNDVFGPSKAKKTQGNANTFRHLYDSGGIPCRICHGSVKMTIQWESGASPDILPFDPFLTKFCEGLTETTHPYSFISKQGALELLQAHGARGKAFPLLNTLI